MGQANAIFWVRYFCWWANLTTRSAVFVDMKRNFQMIAVNQGTICAGPWLSTVAETMKPLPASFDKPC